MRKHVLGSVLLAVAVLLSSGVALAQTIIAVDITKATLQWDAGAGGGTPTKYRVQCGVAPGAYTLPVQEVPSPIREIPVQVVVTREGAYFCVVTAANDFGESGASNEVQFRAGTAPASPQALRVVGQ